MEIFTDFKPVATVLHVLSVVFGMGGAVSSDILFTFYAKDRRLSRQELFTLFVLARVVWYSLIFIILSGLMIFVTDIPKYLSSDKFMSKITILGILFLNGFILHRFVWPHLMKRSFFTAKSEKGMRKLAFACGAISIISWISVCTLGVLDKVSIGYEQIMILYIGILMIGIPSALFIEKRELENKLKA